MEFSKKRGPALTSPRPVSRKSVNYRGYPEETCSDIHPARDDVPRIEPQLLGVESFSMGKFTPIRAVPDVVGVGVKRIGKVRTPPQTRQTRPETQAGSDFWSRGLVHCHRNHSALSP